MGHNYPCRNCVVGPVCSKFCDELLHKSEILKFLVDNGRCPDCGGIEIGWDGDRDAIHYLILCSYCKTIFVIYPNTTMRPYKGSSVKLRAHLREGKLFKPKKYSTKVSIKDFSNDVLRDVKYLRQIGLFEDYRRL